MKYEWAHKNRSYPRDMSDNPLIPKPTGATSTEAAVEFIRAKVSRAYGNEPDAAEELAEAQTERTPSKHQQFMQELSASGKSLAEIQTEWHRYYTQLPDSEKHEVWQEFYAAQNNTPYQKLFQKQVQVATRKRAEGEAQHVPTPQPSASGVTVVDHTPSLPPEPDRTAAQQLKRKIVNTVNANGKLRAKHHLQSLGFGLATGCIVLIVFLFTFFNEYIIAPFIQPSRNVSSTPIILGDTTASASALPSVTVPKINIQIPVDFGLTTNDEATIDKSLESGVVHYPSTVKPGQNGNAAFFGHSSGNIFNNGKYKFAFTLLHNLTTGDLFYITYGGKTYAYRVFAREVVPPSAVSVLNDTKGKQATATLITCDPPGISTNRLVVWGEQISPNITTNTTADPAVTTTAAPTQIAGNGPTLWSRFVGWLEFWK